MKKQISEKQFRAAYLKGKLGSEEAYHVWTPLWALRSRIWTDKSMRKVARDQLGDLDLEAIGEADPDHFRMMTRALEAMLRFERSPRNALLADVFFAAEELNEIKRSFTRADLLKWLNEEMDAAMSAEDVTEGLEALGLARAVPVRKAKKTAARS